MQGNKALSTIVAVIAVMIVISAVAIPVFSSMSDSVYATADNENYAYRMEVYDASATYRIEKTDTGIAVNGTEYTYETYISDVLGGYAVYRVSYVSDNSIVRVVLPTSAQTIQISLTGIVGASASYDLNTTGSYVEWADGVQTVYVASTGTTYSMSYTVLIAPEADGSWAAYSSTSGAHPWVTHGGTYYALTSNSSQSTTGCVRITEGGDATSVKTYALVDDTIQNIKVSVDTVTVADGDRSAQVSYPTVMYGDTSLGTWSLLVPIEYHVVSDSQQTLLSIVDVIPLLIVVMVLIVTAYGIIRAREE